LSILGPILYAIFVAPLLDLQAKLSFAADSYVFKANKLVTELIKDMEKTLEDITNWLRQSGLKVNQANTNVCLFCKKKVSFPIHIMLGNQELFLQMLLMFLEYFSTQTYNGHTTLPKQ
jgi:hypothetical protein